MNLSQLSMKEKRNINIFFDEITNKEMDELKFQDLLKKYNYNINLIYDDYTILSSLIEQLRMKNEINPYFMSYIVKNADLNIKHENGLLDFEILYMYNNICKKNERIEVDFVDKYIENNKLKKIDLDILLKAKNILSDRDNDNFNSIFLLKFILKKWNDYTKLPINDFIDYSCLILKNNANKSDLLKNIIEFSNKFIEELTISIKDNKIQLSFEQILDIFKNLSEKNLLGYSLIPRIYMLLTCLKQNPEEYFNKALVNMEQIEPFKNFYINLKKTKLNRDDPSYPYKNRILNILEYFYLKQKNYIKTDGLKTKRNNKKLILPNTI